MIQSQQVLEWMAEGETKGRIEGKLGMLLRVLRARFNALPSVLEAAIQTTSNLDQLDQWADLVVNSSSLADFRRRAGI
jgi:hypothetical protein